MNRIVEDLGGGLYAQLVGDGIIELFSTAHRITVRMTPDRLRAFDRFRAACEAQIDAGKAEEVEP